MTKTECLRCELKDNSAIRLTLALAGVALAVSVAVGGVNAHLTYRQQREAAEVSKLQAELMAMQRELQKHVDRNRSNLLARSLWMDANQARQQAYDAWRDKLLEWLAELASRLNIDPPPEPPPARPPEPPPLPPPFSGSSSLYQHVAISHE